MILGHRNLDVELNILGRKYIRCTTVFMGLGPNNKLRYIRVIPAPHNTETFFIATQSVFAILLARKERKYSGEISILCPTRLINLISARQHRPCRMKARECVKKG